MPRSPTEGRRPLLSLASAGVCYRRRRTLRSAGALHWALSDVSFEVMSGETVGILGRNGSGKTTLLKVLAGIIEPDRGKIERNHSSISMLSLQVGFLPQLSGRENALLSSVLLGEDRMAAKRNLEAIVRFAGLEDCIDDPLATYSSGMRARLGFSVAYHTTPELLLIDEVLGVGDQEFRQKSTAAIKELIKSDRTVVLVSHNLPTIRELCDRVVWIENGESRMVGPTEEVIEAYLS